MQPFKFDKIKRVLCLGAHSDDIEIGCERAHAAFLETWTWNAAVFRVWAAAVGLSSTHCY